MYCERIKKMSKLDFANNLWNVMGYLLVKLSPTRDTTTSIKISSGRVFSPFPLG